MDAYDSLREKVAVIFAEMAGERGRRLCCTSVHSDVISIIAAALSGEKYTQEQYLHNDEISFNLSDWAQDAAFLVALHLYPERFTAEEIRDGFGLFMAEVPYHVSELTRLVEENPCQL